MKPKLDIVEARTIFTFSQNCWLGQTMTVVLVWPDKGIPKKCKKLEIIHFLHLLWWWLCVSRVIPLFPAHKTRDLNNWGKVRQKAEKKGKIWAVAKPSRGFIPPPLRWLCRTNWRRRWWIKYEPVKGLAPIWVRRRGLEPFHGGCVQYAA